MSENSPSSSDVYQEYSEFYDVYVGDRQIDLPLYKRYAANSGTSILEIGAGSGRLTIPLANEGYDVVAVDISPSMLAILKEKLAKQSVDVKSRIRVVEADVCNLDLGQKFDLIMVPFYTFNYMLTPQIQRRALSRIRSHLNQSGHLILDVFNPVGRINTPVSGPPLISDVTDPATGRRVRHWNTFRFDPKEPIEHTTHRFETTHADGLVQINEFSVQRRHFFSGELEQLAVSQGFKVLAVSTGYEGDTPLPNSEQLVYILGLDT